jgi:hypothetical protein
MAGGHDGLKCSWLRKTKTNFQTNTKKTLKRVVLFVVVGLFITGSTFVLLFLFDKSHVECFASGCCFISRVMKFSTCSRVFITNGWQYHKH